MLGDVEVFYTLSLGYDSNPKKIFH